MFKTPVWTWRYLSNNELETRLEKHLVARLREFSFTCYEFIVRMGIKFNLHFTHCKTCKRQQFYLQLFHCTTYILNLLPPPLRSWAAAVWKWPLYVVWWDTHPVRVSKLVICVNKEYLTFYLPWLNVVHKLG